MRNCQCEIFCIVGKVHCNYRELAVCTCGSRFSGISILEDELRFRSVHEGTLYIQGTTALPGMQDKINSLLRILPVSLYQPVKMGRTRRLHFDLCPLCTGPVIPSQRFLQTDPLLHLLYQRDHLSASLGQSKQLSASYLPSPSCQQFYPSISPSFFHQSLQVWVDS